MAAELLKLKLALQSKSVHLIDKPGVIARTNNAAATLEFHDSTHPDPVILFPKSLVR